MPSSESKSGNPIAVVGGGVIGLAIAWRLARAGRRVVVFERDRAGQGASRVAAGMIAAVAEAGFDDPDFVGFARASRERYPSFIEELQADADMRVPFAATGSLVVALHRDDAEAMRRTYDYRVSIGLPVEWLTGTQARELEPALTPRVNAAMWIAADAVVETRALIAALARACAQRGVEIHEGEAVEHIRTDGDKVRGVTTPAGETGADVVVLAAGAWSGTAGALPPDLAPPIRPVKGQLLHLKRTREFALRNVVRAPRAYLLPAGPEYVIVGATQEEAGFDLVPTAGAIKDILAHAWEAVPSIYDLPFKAVEVGLRPASRDHRPVIGETRVRGLVMATGHFRHGILLAPATADAVCQGIVNGRFGGEVAAFAPSRFNQV